MNIKLMSCFKQQIKYKKNIKIINKENLQIIKMLSMFIRSFGYRPVNMVVNKNKYLFTGYRKGHEQENSSSYKQKRDYSHNRKLFKTQNQIKKAQKQFKIKSENQSNVEEFVKNINQINKEFLGIKLNTDYFKIYNQKTFDQVCKADKTQLFKLNDLPFAVRSRNMAPNQNIESESKLKQNAAYKMLKGIIAEHKLNKQLQGLAKTYFSDIILKQRKTKIQPNFEAYARKVVQTLRASRCSFKLSNTEINPKVILKNVSLFKGVRVNRNDNYTVDSYQVNLDEAQDGITTYTLWKKQREEYPEAEWFAQKFIVARIEAQVSNCPVIEVNEQNGMQSWTKGITHSFVFQADLTVPPGLSQLILSNEEYLKSYRLKPENIYITNVDNKNIWFSLAYKEEEKKNRLINKLI